MLWLCAACYYPGNSLGQSEERVQVGRQKPNKDNT